MNLVFKNQLRKGRGVISLSAPEKKALAVTAGVCLILFNVIAALVTAALIVVIMQVHRRFDNHRFDHLELLARRLGMTRTPCFSLCEKDTGYQRYRPR